ncbi:hypothetical protein [Xenorhabdus szentirmaii]|uniref:hypothetical protein n=1 Tax=Xenorhabdus szentirmaii TaxID=290112 RepID=UPI00199FFB9C|nr:hypothetical protein [Xenorhabdus sp. 38]MBD2781956.1 hypothetical protein [Xenorhabdus sp. 38]
MANVFDFELHADENATKALADIEARIKQLNPMLDSTREALRFGGSETLETTGSLGNQLRDMSRYAQDNVQNISDMIPPLKNFGELFTKYSGMASKMGLFGGIGGAIGGMAAGYKTLRDMGKEATKLDTLSKNTAMSIEDTTKLTGALVQVGADADDAQKSVQNLFNVLNSAQRGENPSVLAELNNLGIKIHTTKDGSADTIPTLLELEKVFKNKKIPSETENRLIAKLGLTPEILTLLRGGKIQERLDKSVKYGQSRTAEENQKLTEFDTEANEISARIDGLWNRAKILGATWFLDKSQEAKESPEMKSIQDYKMREKDTADNFYHGNKDEDMRQRALRDKKFQETLSFKEDLSLTINKPDKGLQKKLNDYYGELWEKQKKVHEEKMQASKIPPLPKYEAPNYANPLKKSGKQPRGIRNNNPGNLTAAPHAVGKDYGNGHVYVKFATPHDGISAMARQIMLDAERGLNTIDALLNKYASEKAGNKTNAYADFVSERTGYTRNQPIDLLNPDELEKVMVSMIQLENDNINPYSKEQIEAGIRDAIHNDRWKGLRNPQKIREQRLQYGSGEQEQQFPSLYSKRKETESEVDIAKGMAKAFLDAVGDKTQQVEIILVNDKTGERQVFQSKSAGKVTTSMQYP